MLLEEEVLGGLSLAEDQVVHQGEGVLSTEGQTGIRLLTQLV